MTQKNAHRVALFTGWGRPTGPGLAELAPIWDIWASNEAAQKAGNGTHIAIRIDNLRLDSKAQVASRVWTFWLVASQRSAWWR